MRSSSKRKEVIDKIAQLADILCLAVLALCLIRKVGDTTMLSLEWPALFDTAYLRVAEVLITAVRIACCRDGRKRRLWLMASGYSLVFLCCYLKTGEPYLLDIAVYMVAMVGLPCRTILGLFAAIQVLIRVIAFIAAESGLTENLIAVNYRGMRHYLGIAFPTDAGAGIFFTMLAIWLTGLFPDAYMAAASLAAAALVRYYCSARNAALSLAALGVFIIIGMIAVRLRARKTEKQPVKSDGAASASGNVDAGADCADTAGKDTAVTGWPARLGMLAMPLAAAGIIALTALYPLLENLQVFLKSSTATTSTAGRLYYAHEAMAEHGLSLLGKYFRTYGMGSLTYTDELKAGTYSFVDFSYVRILLRHGLAALAIFIVLYILQYRRAMRTGNRRLMAALVLAALSSILEHHYMELPYNIFLVTCFAELGPAKRQPQSSRASAGINQRSIGTGRRRWLRSLCITACAALFCACLPGALDVSRTVVTLLDRGATESGQGMFVLRTAGILLLAAAAAVMLWQALQKLLQKLLRKNSQSTAGGVKGKAAPALGMAALAAAGAFLLWNGEKHLITEHAGEADVTLVNAEAVMEALADGAEDGDYAILVDDLPVLYQQRWPGLTSRHVFRDEELFDRTDAVIITDVDVDNKLLLDYGFRYRQISETQALYTNSEEAISRLEEAGLPLSGAYRYRRDIEPASLTVSGGLVLTEEGYAIIDATNGYALTPALGEDDKEEAEEITEGATGISEEAVGEDAAAASSIDAAETETTSVIEAASGDASEEAAGPAAEADDTLYVARAMATVPLGAGLLESIYRLRLVRADLSQDSIGRLVIRSRTSGRIWRIMPITLDSFDENGYAEFNERVSVKTSTNYLQIAIEIYPGNIVQVRGINYGKI